VNEAKTILLCRENPHALHMPNDKKISGKDLDIYFKGLLAIAGLFMYVELNHICMCYILSGKQYYHHKRSMKEGLV
jgi:hypothetical protein